MKHFFYSIFQMEKKHMKLKEHTLIILLLFLMLFVCIGSVSALENQTDDISENAVIEISENEVIGIDENPEILTENEYTYNDLKEQISSGIDVTLVKGTYTYGEGDGDTIVIGDSIVIDGNGSVIDMAGSGKRAFEVTQSGVTIKNLTIKNANFNGKGGAIYFNQPGTVEDCNFINNNADEAGGAIYFKDKGTVINCNFTGNKATGESCYGGALYIYQKGDVKNCNFANNSAWGAGAVLIGSASVTNCNFIYNTAIAFEGGAIWFETGSVTNCNFTGNKASQEGGAVYLHQKGTVINCNFVNSTANYGGAVHIDNELNYGGSNVINCTFINNTATSLAVLSRWLMEV